MQASILNSHSLHPDLYVGIKAGSATYTKWFYQVEITACTGPAGHTPHLRIGWAHPTLFRPHPSSNGTYTLGQYNYVVSPSRPASPMGKVGLRMRLWTSLSHGKGWLEDEVMVSEVGISTHLALGLSKV